MSVIIDNLTVSYNRHPAIHHISGKFESGSLTAIAGPNGAGKSTLLKALAGMAHIDSGEINFGDIKPHEIGYLPQAAEIVRDFPLSVLQLVISGAWHKTGAFGKISAEIKQKASEALATVNLAGFEERNIGQLSTGQFQRVLFARLLLQDAKLLLLDEPFTAIDQDTESNLLNIIRRWNEEKRTVICVLHDLNQIRSSFPQCVLMARKCIGWGNSVDTLCAENLSQARMFHEAWSNNAEVCVR